MNQTVFQINNIITLNRIKKKKLTPVTFEMCIRIIYPHAKDKN